MTILSGKRGLIIGIANEHSLAYGCARHFHAAGAELAITYLNAKAEPFVRPLADAVQSTVFMPCDVMVPGQLEAVYQRIAKEWGRLDFVRVTGHEPSDCRVQRGLYQSEVWGLYGGRHGVAASGLPRTDQQHAGRSAFLRQECGREAAGCP